MEHPEKGKRAARSAHRRGCGTGGFTGTKALRRRAGEPHASRYADLGRNVLSGWLGFALRLTLLLALDTLEDLFPMDGNVFRCIDTNSHLIALHPKDGDGDIVTDHHGFTHPSRQYEHLFFLLDLGPPGFESRKNPLIEIYGFASMRHIRESLNLPEFVLPVSSAVQ
jgi:hypothetical protein